MKNVTSQFEIANENEWPDWIKNNISPILNEKLIILLSGEMGAGKTTFASYLTKILGTSESATSPTFAIHQVYKFAHGEIDHFDLYRLETEDEIETSGIWDCFAKSKGLILIEWPQRIPIEFLPKDWPMVKINIDLNHVNSFSRKITFEFITY